MSANPIAIVGRACLLPGAHTPAQLWDAVVAGQDLVSSVPPARWGLDPDRALCAPDDDSTDRTWSDRGGYVRGFEELFDPTGFAVEPSALEGLDPVFLWVLHTAREALRDAGDHRRGDVERPKVGAVFGNLGFPTAGMAAYAAAVWDGESQRPDARNRFMGSGPARLLTEAMGLGGGAFCLDAACASSLYAIKLACDQLQDGVLDLALAGAVQAADDLFIHMGFCALGAFSKTGRSRPFNSQADGLVPAEGAGFVALKRLSDARRDGDHIYGVIRGVGLSNDGRGKSLLAPAAEGQERAIRGAYQAAELSPAQVSLLECHATGTSVGDGIEVASTAAVYAGLRDVPMGSLKSNMGHLITVAGVAGLIKVLEAMRAGVRPPTLHATPSIPALENSPFRLLHQAEPWESDGLRLAGVSAFGFGGNNAHLLVSEEGPEIEAPASAPGAASGHVALVAIGAVVGSAADHEGLARAMADNRPLTSTHAGQTEAKTQEIALDLRGLRFPPKDLQLSLGQQLATLRAARAAMHQVAPLKRERTGVLIGLEPDPEVARWGMRWRLPPTRHASRDGVVAALTSGSVVGSMPNIPANRLSSQFDVAGPAFAVSAGAESGLVAVRLAARALRRGELDAVLVGAADLSCETVHQAALRDLGAAEHPPGDAAVVWVLERLSDARAANHTVYAIVDTESGDTRNTVNSGHDTLVEDPDTPGDMLPPTRYEDHNVAPITGSATAASGLVNATVAALDLHRRTLLGGAPWISTGGAPRRATAVPRRGTPLALEEDPQSPPTGDSDSPVLCLFAGRDPADLLARLRSGQTGGDGPCRVAFAATPAQHADRLRLAIRAVETGDVTPMVHFRSAPIEGDVAFAYTGAGAAYPGMGLPLLRALPCLGDALSQRTRRLPAALGWTGDENVLDQLWGASAVCQLHTELTRGVLKLQPDALIGSSSGETNALLAMGIWSDIDGLIADSEASGLFTHALAGDFAAVAGQWNPGTAAGSAAPEGEPVSWASWAVLAPVSEVRQAIAPYPRVHLAIEHTATDCVIAGDAAACERAVDDLGRSRCLKLGYDLAVHVPELGAVADAWLDLHRRETTPVDGVRVYGNAMGGAYVPTSEACAQAILGQADRTLHLPPTIEAAWADGVRVFVEHGPQAALGRWIKQILGDRDALVVSLDRKGQGVAPTLDAVAALWAAGVPVDHAALTALLPRPAAAPDGPRRDMTFAAHPPAVDVREPTQPMAPAPALPPVVGAGWRHVAPSVLPTAPTVLAAEALGAQSGVADLPTSPAPPSRPIAVPATPIPVPAMPLPSPPRAAARPQVSMMSDADNPQASPVFQQHMAHMAQLGAIQRDFQTQQQALHQRFLMLRQHSMQALLQAAGNAAAAAPAGLLETLQQVPVTAQAPVAPTVPEVPAPVAPVVVAPTPVPAVPSPAVSSVAVSSPVVPAPSRAPVAFSRQQLEVHAAGRISEIFGAQFAPQDGYARQVRMPEPPLLLCDRVIDIDAEPNSMKLGSIITETDVCWDSWYLNQDRMPAAILIESGQADLFLISYLGIDLINRGERVYRLLGCELTYHGDLPRAGETLRYDIHVDGHAAQGDIRLFFFHYNCMVGDRPQLTVREGQAGFFTDEELADSDGCLWTPEGAAPIASPRLDPPAVACERSTFDRQALTAFSEGRPADCFGPGYEATCAHTRSPSIQSGQMLLLDRVTHFEAGAGPTGWGRGYLRAELDVSPDLWFFDGHFKNDPCMPGTLMFEGCLQAMAFYIAGMGFTLQCDGWRFQPVAEMPFQLSCRGQVLPTSRLMVTEIFVEEVVAGPRPTLYADLLCTVDGLKAFHAKRVALELVPDWPLEAMPELLDGHVDVGPVASVDGFDFGYASLLACAWGKPSDAFPMYGPFDGPRRVARLPGPPYHFMTRVAALDGPMGVMEAGSRCTLEYDIPADAWYFDENGCRSMPYAVLLEAALQPCGWLASYVGSALTIDSELGFRNLDGTGTLHVELFPDSGTLRTEVLMTSVSQMGPMIIQGFEVQCFLGEVLVFEMTTKFGFFEPAALASQAGLPSAPASEDMLVRGANIHRDLTVQDAPYWEPGRPQLAAPMLLMQDRVTGYWPQAGEAGLGQMRAEKSVDPSEWFFKAHFFQDPVQPGSLGIEAMIQLLQIYMIEANLDAEFTNPRFEPIGLNSALTWKYRGQVRIPNTLIQTTLEIVNIERSDDSVTAWATASLWVDGARIYEANGLAMRIVSGGAAPNPGKDVGENASNEVTLDLATAPWIGDHRPTWTAPSLPMMSVVDLLAGAVSEPVVGVRDVRIKRWLLVERPVSLRTEVQPAPGHASGQHLVTLFDDHEEVASARILTGAFPARPPALTPLSGPTTASPYDAGTLFHGPAFQVLRSLIRTAEGASSVLNAESGVPLGRLNPALLDGATHGIPHDALHQWDARLSPDKVAYPALLQQLDLYGPTPSRGTVRCEVRFAGLLGGPEHPMFDIQLIGDDGVWAAMRLVEACFPKGPLGAAAPDDRRAFLRDGLFVPGLSLSSHTDAGSTRLSEATVSQSDWLPGTVESVYGTRNVGQIAVQEHIAAAHRLHPAGIESRLPLTRFDLDVRRGDGNDQGAVEVLGDPRGRLDLAPIRAFWTEWFGRGPWPVEDLYYGLIDRFLDRVVLEDPADFAQLRGRSVLYLANHQVGVESLIFSVVASGLGGVPTVTLAKMEHKHTWLGRLIAHCFSYPGVADPRLMTFFDRQDKQSLTRIIGELGIEMRDVGRSVMVHIEGTRSLSCRTPVQKMSGIFIDMAIAAGAAIVPVRFVGGLPVEPVETRLEFPVGMGKQEIHFGRALTPEMLAAMHYGARKSAVIDAINGLGPSNDVESPLAGDPAFAAQAEAWQTQTGVSAEHATLRSVLAQLAAPGEPVQRLLAATRASDIAADNTPEGQWLFELASRLLVP